MLLQSHWGCTCRRFSVRYHRGAGSVSPQNSPHQDLDSQVAAIPKLTLCHCKEGYVHTVVFLFFLFLCAQFWQGACGGFILFTKKKQLNCMGRLLGFCKAAEPHRFLSCLRCLKHAWNCYLWVRSGVFFILIFTMVIPRMSGWVFPILPEDWLEISERNSELLRAELTVNIQLVFMIGLCRCYFFSSLPKKGVYFQLSATWLASVIIPAMPCSSQPCRKGRRGKSCRESRWRACA